MKKLALIIILLAFTPIFAQVEFVAKVSKSTVGLNERFRIEFQMNEDGDNFIPPGFENFRVLSGPMQQVSQSWINGKSSFNKNPGFTSSTLSNANTCNSYICGLSGGVIPP